MDKQQKEYYSDCFGWAWESVYVSLAYTQRYVVPTGAARGISFEIPSFDSLRFVYCYGADSLGDTES